MHATQSEVEKGLSGVGSEGDSGVSTRIFGKLLTWMNDHESDVFLAMSANDVTRLPAPFTRAERLDRVFMVDLPTDNEKNVIWNMYLKQYQVKTDQLPDDANWSGAEIKACCRLAKALDVPLMEAAEGIVPVSLSSMEEIECLRNWANDRVIDASTGTVYKARAFPKGKRSVSRK